jgi:Kef-type K+ transport system membrane component KefB
MPDGGLVTSFFLIFAGAAVLATAALYTRQPLIVAYVAVGMILGPSATGLVGDPDLLAEVAEIGIIFLLFLLGLDMQPSKLLQMLRQTLLVGIASSLIFAGIGYGIARLFGFGFVESLVIGAAMMFSSTIIGIKLLPTTVLHHRHTGEVVVSLLLLQDLIAILVLLAIAPRAETGLSALIGAPLGVDAAIWSAFLALPLLLVFSFAFVRWVLLPLLRRFDVFHEYVFLLAVGWCLAIAEAAVVLGLSLEIGAFIAGVALATNPVSQYIAESLRPLRDFFLVLFFFSVGAGFDLGMLGSVLLPTLLLAAVMLGAKPLVFRVLLQRLKEQNVLAGEVGVRLGQISEFSLLVAYLAEEAGLLGREASTLIQATAIATFLISSYIVVLRYPTPIAVSSHLRRN